MPTATKATKAAPRKAAPKPAPAVTAPPVAVLVPYRPTGPDRAAAWEYVRDLWQATYPTWQLCVADSPGERWCKAAAVAAALAQTEAPVLVVADADVWCDGAGAAVDAVRGGAAKWAVPHTRVCRLTSLASSLVYETGEWPLRRTTTTYAQPPYPGRVGGGMVVLGRETYLATPLDPRFTGWGQEDESWALALRRMAGREWRGTEDLWHLWHAPQPRQSRTVGSREGFALYRRYAAAARDLGRMRSLVSEIA
jgi:hypothetical protein